MWFHKKNIYFHPSIIDPSIRGYVLPHAGTTYTGKIIKPDERILSNHKDITDIDPKNYYFRMSPDFSTDSKKYFWLNDLVTIAIGRLIPNGVGYKIFKIK